MTELISGVAKWLDENGQALELRVARSVRQIGDARVQHSFNYLDVVTGLSRESDVVAKFEWTGIENTPCSITAVIECKSSNKHPWVAFYSDDAFNSRPDLEDWTTFSHGPFNGITLHLPEKWVGHEPFIEGPVASHVVAAHTKEDWNPARDAIRQVLSATTALRTSYIDHQTRDRVGLVCVAVVVTSAPLLTCRLATTGDLLIEAVDEFDVWGYDVNGKRQRVYVRSEKSLPALAEGLRQRAVAAST